MQAWEGVNGVGEDGAHDERIGRHGDDVGELDVELAVVVDDPAADAGPRGRVDGAGRDAVEADDVVGAEDGVGEQPDHAADGMLGEDVHRVIDADPVFHYEAGKCG